MNINYMGEVSTRVLAKKHHNALILVVDEPYVMNYLTPFQIQNRDYDILDESLSKKAKLKANESETYDSDSFSDAINSSFFLVSDHYVTERLSKIINKATSLMIEHGLYSFFTSINDFKRNILFRENSNHDDIDDDDRALTLEQLKRPIILIVCLWTAALFAFVVEVIIDKFSAWWSMRLNAI